LAVKISVFTDLRFTKTKFPTGVGKHVTQKVTRLASKTEPQVSILAAHDQVDEIRANPQNTLYGLPAKRLPLPWKAAEAVWTVFGRPACDEYCEDADWVYCPKNDFIPLRNKKLAITIHGAHELDPDFPRPQNWYSKATRIRRRMSYRRIVERANLIFTVSEFLKRQVIEWFDCDPAKVAIVGNGVDSAYFDYGKKPKPETVDIVGQHYVVSVGGLNELDGGKELLQIARILENAKCGLKIKVAGVTHDPTLVQETEAIGNVELLGYVESSALAALLHGALALVYVPRYETFGIAAAEAMAAGTPVVTTGGTAVPEILGEAGIYRTTPGECAEALFELKRDETFALRFIHKGQLIANAFTWSACVQRAEDAFRRHDLQA
jgi:glycosyltransferase involved in cell wall biosynthesis